MLSGMTMQSVFTLAIWIEIKKPDAKTIHLVAKA